MSNSVVVTIDGPAGAGKSSAARALANRLSFDFLDTGAMYRSIALAALRAGCSDQPELLRQLAETSTVELRGDRVFLDGEDVTDAVRDPAVTESIHCVADNPSIRERMVMLQRQIVRERSFVTEGRDQGTVVFPDAVCKFFLTATSQERARRRHAQLSKGGSDQAFSEVLAELEERDRRDSQRSVGRLEKAGDAIEIVTDGLTMAEVVDRLEAAVLPRLRTRRSE